MTPSENIQPSKALTYAFGALLLTSLVIGTMALISIPTPPPPSLDVPEVTLDENGNPIVVIEILHANESGRPQPYAIDGVYGQVTVRPISANGADLANYATYPVKDLAEGEDYLRHQVPVANFEETCIWYEVTASIHLRDSNGNVAQDAKVRRVFWNTAHAAK